MITFTAFSLGCINFITFIQLTKLEVWFLLGQSHVHPEYKHTQHVFTQSELTVVTLSNLCTVHIHVHVQTEIRVKNFHLFLKAKVIDRDCFPN